MTPSDFVTLLAAVSPMVATLKEEGYPEEIAQEVVNAFHPRKVSSTFAIDDALIQLGSEYEFSGPLPFNIQFSPPEVEEDFVIVGYQEGELLIVDKETREVCIEENGSPQRWLFFRCAKDSSAFLEAYGHALSHLYRRPHGNFDEIAEHCAHLAGGPQYIKFYYALFPPTNSISSL